MKTRNVTAAKRRRKMFAVLWSALFAIGTMMLIYWEMTALLYILATLGVTAILVIVAVSDLARGEKHRMPPSARTIPRQLAVVLFPLMEPINHS